MLKLFDTTLDTVDKWALRQMRLLPEHGGLGLCELWPQVQLDALRGFMDFAASCQTLGPLAAELWTRMATQREDGPLGGVRAHIHAAPA